MDELDRELAEMERELEGLAPAALDEATEARLAMRLEREAQEAVAGKVLWLRVAPMIAAAAVLMAGLFLLLRVDEETGAGGSEMGTVVEEGVSKEGDLWARLEPVAAQNILRETSEGGIAFVSGEVPYREVYLDYEDAYRWRDPETETELTYYQPRREVMYVPVTVY